MKLSINKQVKSVLLAMLVCHLGAASIAFANPFKMRIFSGGDAQFKQMKDRIEHIDRIKPQNYTHEIPVLREEIDRFIEDKRLACNGHPVGGTAATSLKQGLSNEDRAICFSDLKVLQRMYVEQMFDARKKYLNYLHDQRIKELERIKDEALQNLKN